MTPRRATLGALAAMLAAVVLYPARATGTILEQRRRLPPPAAEDACADPVAGVWRGHAYYPRQRDWYIFTLTIKREGDALAGEIELRGWSGDPSRPDPLPCTKGHEDYRVIQPARGKITGLDLELAGTSWRYGEPYCEPSRSGGYILDTFIGRIDPALQEFQSVNRYPMGGQMVEDVTVFRRIQCLGGEAQPAATPPPGIPPAEPAPPRAEPRSRFDCGCGR